MIHLCPIIHMPGLNSSLIIATILQTNNSYYPAAILLGLWRKQSYFFYVLQLTLTARKIFFWHITSVQMTSRMAFLCHF